MGINNTQNDLRLITEKQMEHLASPPKKSVPMPFDLLLDAGASAVVSARQSAQKSGWI